MKHRSQSLLAVVRFGLTACAASLAATAVAKDAAKTAAKPAGPPQVFCAQPVYNFGTREDQDTVRHTFILENRGRADLQLLNVRTTCGCTSAELSQRTVPPGGKAEVRTVFVLRGRKGHEIQKAYVRTDDPQTPTIGLTLEGQVTRTFVLDPSEIVFRPRSRDNKDQWSQTVTLDIKYDKPFTITKLKPSQPKFFSAKVVKKGHNNFQIEVTLDKDYFISRDMAQGRLTIYTSHPKYKQLYVAVRAYVPPVLRIMPLRLENATWRGHPPRDEQTVVVRSEVPGAVKVIGVETPKGLKAKVQMLRTFIIKIDGFAKNSAALKGKEVRIRAKVEGKDRVFTVPIQGGR